jgi:predicted membrane-bound mannosyltransferase
MRLFPGESRVMFGLSPLDGIAALLREPWISWMPEAWYPDDARTTARSFQAPDAAPEVLDPVVVALPARWHAARCGRARRSARWPAAAKAGSSASPASTGWWET